MIWIALTVFVLVGGCVLGYSMERRAWNGGHCDRCGGPWRFFAMDSQGGRGYVCRNHETSHYGPWISYPGIDR